MALVEDAHDIDAGAHGAEPGNQTRPGRGFRQEIRSDARKDRQMRQAAADLRLNSRKGGAIFGT